MVWIIRAASTGVAKCASEAMGELLDKSFNHYKVGERAFHLAAELANGAQAWRLDYSDPRQAAELLARAAGL